MTPRTRWLPVLNRTHKAPLGNGEEKMIRSAWMAALAVSFGALAGSALAQEKPAALGLGVLTFTSGPAAAYGMPGNNAAEQEQLVRRVRGWLSPQKSE